MAEANVHRLMTSSSATSYGEPAYTPVPEDCSTAAPVNPYGRFTLMVEAFLQYFNPVSAHPNGQIDEESSGMPNKVLPYISQVAVGALKVVAVFGDDYSVRDLTRARDYILVVDLVNGHSNVLDAIAGRSGLNVWNLDTGNAYSELETIDAFERESGRQISCQSLSRRPGNNSECWAHSSKALRELGWKAEGNFVEMMADIWRCQSNTAKGPCPCHYAESSNDCT